MMADANCVARPHNSDLLTVLCCVLQQELCILWSEATAHSWPSIKLCWQQEAAAWCCMMTAQVRQEGRGTN